MKSGTIIGIIVVVIIIIAAGAYLATSSGRKAASSTSTLSTILYPTTIQTNATNSSTSILATTTIASTNSTTINSTNSLSSNSVSYSVHLITNSTYGTYLANASNFTLYTYSGDTPNSSASNCYGSCATNWPPEMINGTLSLPSGLNASSFNTITRTGGAMQLTYNGLPLYKFVSDTKAGMVSGNNVGGFKLATT